MKKILALMLCIVFVLLACTSCNVGDKRDFTKIKIFRVNVLDYKCPENEEQFNEYLDNYIKQLSHHGNYTDLYIFSDLDNEITDKELENIKYIKCEKRILSTDETQSMIILSVRLEDIDREAIMDLTMNEKLNEIWIFYYEKPVAW